MFKLILTILIIILTNIINSSYFHKTLDSLDGSFSERKLLYVLKNMKITNHVVVMDSQLSFINSSVESLKFILSLLRIVYLRKRAPYFTTAWDDLLLAYGRKFFKKQRDITKVNILYTYLCTYSGYVSYRIRSTLDYITLRLSDTQSCFMNGR